MIYGNDKVEVSAFRLDGNAYRRTPRNGRTFLGVPAGFYGDGSEPVIEIVFGSAVEEIINCRYVVSIWLGLIDDAQCCHRMAADQGDRIQMEVEA